MSAPQHAVRAFSESLGLDSLHHSLISFDVSDTWLHP